jgi:hypothetical protein
VQVISGTVALSNITIQGGNALPNVELYGGGIFNGGSMHLDHVTITHNSNGEMGDGGGIYNGRGATLTIANSSILGNNAGGGVRGIGGGIFNGGSIHLDRVTIAHNSAEYNAGGIYNGRGATLTIANSSIVENSVGDGSGGGILNYGQLHVTNSTIQDNRVSGEYELGGGGIASYGSLTVVDSVVAHNHTSMNGGGIASSGPLTVTNSAVISNTALAIERYYGKNAGGGGIYSTGPFLLSGSVISGNTTEGYGGGLLITATIWINEVTITHNLASADYPPATQTMTAAGSGTAAA